jgi:cutinase
MMRTSIVLQISLAAVAVARPHIQGLAPDIDTLIKRQGGCKEATVIFCRGTMEPGGPVGMLVGTPFTNAVRSTMGVSKVEIKGVTYDAGIMGYLIGGDPAGATTMVKLVRDTLQKCPTTKIILGGYR